MCVPYVGDANLGINASAANDNDRTGWSFADLAFRLEMNGTINMFATDGLPDLAAGDGSSLEIGLSKLRPAATPSSTVSTLVS